LFHGAEKAPGARTPMIGWHPERAGLPAIRHRQLSERIE
jgi:hypothetical protein